MTPLHLVWVTFAVVCAACWILSIVTKEHSWVDRMWSITPVIYVGEFARAAHFHNTRLNVMALIVLAWGARLTFNFARKGGYSGAEDYRWPVLRAAMKNWQFQLFNIFFIVLYQNFLLVSISLPALTAYRHQGTVLEWRDDRRSTAVEFPRGQEEVDCYRGSSSEALFNDWALQVFAPPQLLLRDIAVVGALLNRMQFCRITLPAHHCWSRASYNSLHRFYWFHRKDFTGQISGIR